MQSIDRPVSLVHRNQAVTDDSSSAEGNEVDEENNSGENDVEYAEFSMAYRLPSDRNDIARNNVLSAPSSDSIMNEELMLLTLLDDTPFSSNVGGEVAVQRRGCMNQNSLIWLMYFIYLFIICSAPEYISQSDYIGECARNAIRTAENERWTIGRFISQHSAIFIEHSANCPDARW